MSRHLLIVGSGSVGKRHAQNLAALGCRISCVDPRDDRRAELTSEVPTASSYADLPTALRDAVGLDGVVVCSPPSCHEEQTVMALQKGLPVLLEKPATPDLAGCLRIADAQRAAGVPLLLGYTWRWWPPLAKVRQLLADGAIGPLRSAHFFMSAHLADWHPWESYQDFFMASHALGGGALLDESHWIDLLLWFFGLPDSVSGRVEKLSDLEIDSDDNVDILAAYPDRLRTLIHLDIYGRPHEKYIRFIGEQGSLLWTAEPNRISIGVEALDWKEKIDFYCKRNDMFVAVAREFLEILDGNHTPSCTIEDGARVLRIIEAVRESSGSGRTVPIARDAQ